MFIRLLMCHALSLASFSCEVPATRDHHDPQALSYH